MASSITLKSDVLKGSRYFQLKCTQKSNGSAENSSTITWELSAIGDSVWYDTGPTKVIINGTTVYSLERKGWEYGKFPVAQGSASGTITIQHDNDGTKTIDVKFSTAVYTTTVHEYSDSWTLDKIDRYAVITSYSLTAVSETSVKISSSSDVNCDELQYSINGGAWHSGYYNTTITGLSPNTTYNIKIALKNAASQLWTYSDNKKVTTYDYPHCTSAPSFVLGEPVTLTFYNPLNRTFSFMIAGNGQHIYGWDGVSGTTYKGVDGEIAVTALYNSIPNQKSAKYTVETVYNDYFYLTLNGTKPANASEYDNFFYLTQGCKYSVNESKCAPTFSKFTYWDTNKTVTDVTKNNQVLVKGLSTLSVDISEANQMITVPSTTPDYYSVSIDTLSKTGNYVEAGTLNIPVGVVSSAGTKRLNVRAYDSRGVSTLAYKDVTVYDYAKPKITASATRLNNFEASTTIQIGGEYSRLTIGGTDKNTIESVKYRFRESGGTWKKDGNGNDVYIDAVIEKLEAGKFTCSKEIETLDNTKAFEIEVVVEDHLTISATTLTVDVGEAIFFISTSKGKETCYIKGKEIATKDYVSGMIGALATGTIATEDYVSGVIHALYPVGTVVCISTNKNPSTIYGGTWALIDKGFASSNTSNENYFTAGANVVEDGVWVTRAGQTMRIRLNVTINAEITDTGLTLGTFNFSNLGISKMPSNFVGSVTYSDGANGGIAWNLNESTGELNLTDVFDLTPIPKGNTFCIDISFPLVYTQMLDSVCDKFYWKRTA